MRKILRFIKPFWRSFPIQLLFLHFKKNQVLLLFWVFLMVIVLQGFGNSMGIPFLFLDPEYLDKVGFWSFFIMGGTIGGFTASFHITTYIIDSQRFNFLGFLEKPFTRFSLNNSIVPLIFLVIYTTSVISFQKVNGKETADILKDLGGFYGGFLGILAVLYAYFWWTNKDIFKYVVCKLDEKLKTNVKATRAKAMSKLKSAKQHQVKVTNYFDLNLKIKEAPDYRDFYDRTTVLQVFDQNHFNLVSVELFIFVILLTMGIFSDYPEFQIPAAASVVLFLTILIMLTGAFSYWFRGWSLTLVIILLLFINSLIGMEVIKKSYKAFGLNYEAGSATYSLDRLISLTHPDTIAKDKQQTLRVLDAWRSKFPVDSPPKVIFICTSGGGQRSMVWTLNALQHLDSVTDGRLLTHTRLITGASGGLIGAAYFRELKYRELLGEIPSSNDPIYVDNIARDHLNPIIFSLLVNDIFFGFQKFSYDGKVYNKDRGYAFEQQINRNSHGFLDKSLGSYREPELNADIPMLILAPTIINDGRKLYISPLDISYLNAPTPGVSSSKIKGIEFREFYEVQGADDLRFLSALRMSATFPYVTPNITLPSSPRMEIMDAGLTDNYGIADATRFLQIFEEWIMKNTSGVIFLTIRDSQKNSPVEENDAQSLFQKFSSPIQGFYRNFENIQDIYNDNRIEQVSQWFKGKIYNVLIEYNSANNKELKERASLSWRLTDREKQSILQNIHSEKNIAELEKLRILLQN